MSRKDYEAFAAMFRGNLELHGPTGQRAVELVIADAAAIFARDNWAFDAARFFKACGL